MFDIDSETVEDYCCLLRIDWVNLEFIEEITQLSLLDL